MKVELIRHDPEGTPWEYGAIRATPNGITLEPNPGSHEEQNRRVLERHLGDGPPPGEDPAAWLRRWAKSFRGPLIAEVSEHD